MRSSKFLMIAYACDPDGGGEHWLGWGWVELAARDHEVWLITPPKAKSAILREAQRLGNVHPCFVEIPKWFRGMSDRLGGLGSWLRKWQWQRMARQLAKQLHAGHHFNLAQQTTFHTFRIPFAARELGIPSIWGPLAGGESIPPGFESYLPNTARGERARNILNVLTLRLPSIRRSLEDADVLLVSNSTSAAFFGGKYRDKCLIMPANAVRTEEAQAPLPKRQMATKPMLLHVGTCVEARGMPLVFDALSGLPADSLRLVIAGSGPALESWKNHAAKVCPPGMVEFRGRIPREEVVKLYEHASLFVFPSLRDSGGSGLLEAMTRAVPVICLDHGGPAEMVQDQAGILIRVDDPRRTVEELRNQILRLLKNPDEAEAIGLRGRARAITHFTWEGKAAGMKEIYQSLSHS